MGFKERFFRSDNLGAIKRENFSPSGEFPLPLALKRAGELEKRKTFEKMAGFGILAMTTTSAICANKIFAVPTIFFYAASLRYARKYDRLEKQTSISEK